MSNKVQIDGKSLFWDMAAEAYRVKLWLDFGKSLQEFIIALVVFSVVLLVWLFGVACFLIGFLDPRNIRRAYQWVKDVIWGWQSLYETRYSKRARERRNRDLIRNTPRVSCWSPKEYREAVLLEWGEERSELSSWEVEDFWDGVKKDFRKPL